MRHTTNIPKHDLFLSFKGEDAPELKTGDFILTHGSTWIAWLIRFGQSLRFRGEDRKYAYFNHAAFIADPSGELIEVLPQGVVKSHINKYKEKEYVVVRIDASDEDRQEMLFYALSALGEKYDWFEIFAIVLSLLTGLKFSAGFDEELICSTLVAAALERGWTILPRPCTHMIPADLAKAFNIFPPAH